MAQQKAIAHAGAKFIAIYLVLWAGPYMYLDIAMPDANGAYLLLSFVGIGLNFFLLYSLLQVSDAGDEQTKTGFGAYFGLSILHSIAVFIGVLVFVLPGLYLALRWLPAFARVLKSDDGITEALRWSWEGTSGHERDLAIPFLLVTAVYLLGIGPLLATEFLYGRPEFISYETIESLTVSSAVFINIVMAVAAAWYTVLGVASYAWLRSDTSHVAAEFE